MKMRWMVGAAAALTASTVACADARSNDGLVARAGAYELRVEDVAELLVNEERLPANVTVVEQVANLWIQYTLLGEAIAKDSTLSSVDFEVLVRPQLDQMMILQLRDSAVQVDTAIGDEELRTLYAAGDPPFELRSRHILIRYPPNASAAERGGARAQLQSIRDRIVAGESFAALAEQYSHDRGSAAAGGDLGFFGRGDMLPPIDEALFALEPGEMSGLIETQLGLHLIRLEERRIQGFEEIATSFRQRVQAERALQAESTYIAGVEARGEAASTESAFEVVRELARNPGTRLSRRAGRRPIYEYAGGELTVHEVQLVLQGQPAELRDQVVSGDEEDLDRFLRNVVQRELLTAEAEAAGFGVTQERVDSLIEDVRIQLRGAAEVAGLASPDRAPGEELEPAVARAVLEAVGKVLSGATGMVQLGGIEFQLPDRSTAVVFDRGVGQAILRIGQLRANRSPSLLEEAVDTSTVRGDTAS